MPQTSMPNRGEAIALANPVTLATYSRYAAAQRAVDYLSDQMFPVENCMIVGTDLRQLERVTGRLTQQKAALGGMASGAWFGLFTGLILSMFDGQGLRSIVTTVLFGALFGLVWALIGYAATRGQRDFTSVTSVVATRYEVLVEHSHLARAREVLSGLPNNGLASSSAAAPETRADQVPPAAQVQSSTQVPPAAVIPAPAERPAPATPVRPAEAQQPPAPREEPPATLPPSHAADDAVQAPVVPPTQPVPTQPEPPRPSHEQVWGQPAPWSPPARDAAGEDAATAPEATQQLPWSMPTEQIPVVRDPRETEDEHSTEDEGPHGSTRRS